MNDLINRKIKADKRTKKTDNDVKLYDSNIVYSRKHTFLTENEFDKQLNITLIRLGLQIQRLKDLQTCDMFYIEEMLSKHSCVVETGSFSMSTQSKIILQGIIDRLKNGEDIENIDVEGLLEDYAGKVVYTNVRLRWIPDQSRWIVDWVNL